MAYDRCSKQRFAKTKTAFPPESSCLLRSPQFPIRQAIVSNRPSSHVLIRHRISYRRLTFLTYLFAQPRPRSNCDFLIRKGASSTAAYKARWIPLPKCRTIRHNSRMIPLFSRSSQLSSGLDGTIPYNTRFSHPIHHKT